MPVVGSPYKQWISKQLKMIERMGMLKKLKEAKKAAMEAAKYAAARIMVTVHATSGAVQVLCNPADTVLQFKHDLAVAADAQTVSLAPWKASANSSYSIRIGSRFLSQNSCELSVYGVEKGSVLYLEVSPVEHSNRYRSRTARYH